MKKAFSFILTIIMCISLSSCAPQKQRYETQYNDLFDTVTQLVIYTNNKKQFDYYSKSIYEKLKEYHQLYDIYNSYEGVNNIRTINENAGIAPVKVDSRIIELLKFAKTEAEKTSGAVNISMGSVLKIWHDYRENGIANPDKAELPPMSSLESASKHTDIENVITDEANSTVFLKDPEMSLDVGAVAKGYATEQVCRFAKENGLDNALLSVGGNVRAIGGKGNSDTDWNVGIQNPDTTSDEQSVLVTKMRDMSLVTSGDYQRFYTVGGNKYHHIIDPKTLMPSDYFTAVTIMCKDSGLADALSTAVFNMPLDEGKKYINSLDNVEAVWILKNGEMVYSDNFKQFVK